MTKLSGLHLEPLAAAAVLWAPTIIAQANPTRTLGSFPWDTSNADVVLQRVSSDRLIVQVRIVTESTTSSGRRQTRQVPTGAMEAWVLLDDGTALEQTPRQPPKGAPPVGLDNAGDRYSFVSFGFKSLSDAKLSAVVVAMEDRFHVFGTGPGRSRAAQSPLPLIAQSRLIRWPLSDGIQAVSLMDQKEFLLIDLAGPSVPEFRGEEPIRPSATGLQVWVLKKDGTAAPPRSPRRESSWAWMGGWATLSQQLTVGHARFEELAGVLVSVNGKLIMLEMPFKPKNDVVPGM